MHSEKEKTFISAVVYVYNRESCIFDFLKSLYGSLKETFETYEIICVDDCSADGSVAEIRRFAAEHPEAMVSVLHMSFYQGTERSMTAGVDLSIGDFIYEFDHPLAEYPASMVSDVYFHALKGYDIVAAAPERPKRLSSALFYSVFNRTSHAQRMLQTEAFRILSRRAVNRVRSVSAQVPYRKAVYANCGLNADVLYFDGAMRLHQADERTRRKRRETAVDALMMYTDLAWRCSMIFSAFMALVAAGSGIYTVVIYCSGRPVAGWTTTMLILSGGFLGVFVILTILIRYVSMILKLTMQRQPYLTESVEKLK